MSELRANTISNAAGTGPVELTGQSAAKAWLTGNSAAALVESYNISSGTDNGTGDYTYDVTNSMNTATYSVPANCRGQNSAVLCVTEPLSTSSVSADTVNTVPTSTDRGTNVSVLGDLA